MAETLRDLVVSISLNTDDFSRNIKSVQKQMREAESEFKASAAGVKNFETSIDGLNARLTTTRGNFTKQQQVVQQYAKALEAARARLNTTVNNYTKFKQKLDASNVSLSEAEAILRNARNQYEAVSQASANASKVQVESAKRNLDAAQDQYNSLKRLTDQVTAERKAMQNAADAVSQANINYNNATAALKEMGAEIESTEAKLRTAKSVFTSIGNATGAMSEKLNTASRWMRDVGRTMSLYVTTPLVALGKEAVEASIDFESSFASVRKTVDATEQEYDQFAKATKEMSTVVATSAADINEVMAVGGQLGIQNEHLVEFTRTMIDLGNATEDLDAETAATKIAQFMNIMGTSQSEVDRIGSVVVELGNNFATTEAPIVMLAQKLAGAGKQIGMTEAQVLGLSAALSSVGITATVGGSTMSKALVKMELAAEEGGKALKDFAGVCGITEQQFKDLWKANPSEAFMMFIEGLAKLDDEGASAIVTLNDIGISEIRLRDTLLRSTNATELFRRALNSADAEWQKNSALTTEASKRYATMESKLANLKNAAVNLGARVGDDLTPTISSLSEAALNLIDRFNNLSLSQRNQIETAAAVVAASGPMLLLFSKLSKGASMFTGYLSKLAGVAAGAGGGFGGFVAALKSSPMAVVAVTAAVLAGTAAFIDWASGARRAREAVQGLKDTADKWEKTAADTFYTNSSGLGAFGIDLVQKELTATEGYIESLKKVWTDGKRDTDEQVMQYTETFKSFTSEVREELQKLYEEADDDTLKATLQADIDSLDEMDDYVTKLLRIRQNGTITAQEYEQLESYLKRRQELIDTYNLDKGNIYEQLDTALENSVARAKLNKNLADEMKAYEDATVGASQAFAQMNRETDDWYDTQRKLLSIQYDGEELEKKQAELDERYSKRRSENAQEYADFLQGVYSELYDKEGYAKTQKQVDSLYSLILEYAHLDMNGKKDLLPDIEEQLSGFDEGELASLLVFLEQIESMRKQGIDVDTMFPDVETDSIEKLGEILDFTNKYDTNKNLIGLHDSLVAVFDEAYVISAHLDNDVMKADFLAFAESPGTMIDGKLKISGYAASSYAKYVTNGNVPIRAFLDPKKYTNQQLINMFITGGGTLYGPDGLPIHVNPQLAANKEVLDAAKLINGAKWENGSLYSSLYVYGEAADEETHALLTIKDFVDGLDTDSDELSVVVSGMTPSDGKKLVNAIDLIQQSSYNEETGQFEVPVGASVYSLMDAFEFISGHVHGEGEGRYIGIDVKGIAPDTAEEMLNASDIVVGADSDGNLVVFVTPKLTPASQEDMDEWQKELTKETPAVFMDVDTSLLGRVRNFMKVANQDNTGMNGMVSGFASLFGEFNPAKQTLEMDFQQDAVNEMAEQLYQALSWVQQGFELTDEQEQGIGEMLAFLQYLTDNGLGSNILTDIAETMNANMFDGFEYTPENVAEALQRGFDEAGIENDMQAEGFGVGAEFSRGIVAGIESNRDEIKRAIQSSAEQTVEAAKEAYDIHSPSRLFRDEIGIPLMQGLGEGLIIGAREEGRIMRNASGYLTGQALGGARSASGSTVNNNTTNNDTVDVSGNTFVVRDEIDIRTLAYELSNFLTKRRRGRGQA